MAIIEREDKRQIESFLIQQGQALKKTLRKDDSTGWYSFENEDEYTSWKFTSIRIIECCYRNDISIARLIKAFDDFESHYRTPEAFSQILGVLAAYKAIPITLLSHKSNNQPSILINNSQSQNQDQTQSVQIVVDLIKDELKGSQLKELKEILLSDQDDETKKNSLKEKFISFGRDLAPSILANIITNPQIWGALF